MSEEIESEEIVGRPDIIPELESGYRTFRGNYSCSNCRRPKAPIHSYVEKGEFILACTDKNCQCSCRTSYECRTCGRLHRYGNKCNNLETDTVKNPKADKQFNELMSQWTDYQKSKQNEVVIKNDSL